MHTSCVTAIYLCSDDLDSIAKKNHDPSLCCSFALVLVSLLLLLAALKASASVQGVHFAFVMVPSCPGWAHCVVVKLCVLWRRSSKALELEHSMSYQAVPCAPAEVRAFTEVSHTILSFHSFVMLRPFLYWECFYEVVPALYIHRAATPVLCLPAICRPPMII